MERPQTFLQRLLKNRYFATYAALSPFIFACYVFFVLSLFVLIPPWMTNSAWRLSSSLACLREVFRSAGSSSSTPQKRPRLIYFGVFDWVRILIAVFNIPLDYHKNIRDCRGLQDDPNPDIVGSGVRLSMYLLFFTVFASLFIGSFHSGPSGTKELGMAALINLISLTINLLKVKPGDLTSTDVFVIIVMIDTHCVALSATLSSKDALASRLYVRLAIAGQATAWVAVLYTDIRFTTDLSNFKLRECMEEPWFDAVIDPGAQVWDWPFRAYWISHLYDLVQSSILAICHTKRFDKLEKIDREHHDATGDQGENQTGFSRLPSTAFSNWSGFVFYPIMLVVTVERHLSKNEVNVGDFREWGQSFTVITCGCAIAHWVYVNLPLLKHPLECLWRGRWVSLKGPILPTNILRLIAYGAPRQHVGEENYDLLTLRRLRSEDALLGSPTSLPTLPRNSFEGQRPEPARYFNQPTLGRRVD